MGNIRKEIFLKGKKRTDDIVSCVRKGRFYKITFKSHKTYTYNYYDVKIVEPSKEELFIDFHLKESNDIPKLIEEYIYYYNNERPSYALKYKTPIQYKIESGF